jgi:hypothetical protein
MDMGSGIQDLGSGIRKNYPGSESRSPISTGFGSATLVGKSFSVFFSRKEISKDVTGAILGGIKIHLISKFNCTEHLDSDQGPPVKFRSMQCIRDFTS